MPARRMLTMRHLRRIMRLHHEGASAREIVRAGGRSPSSRIGANLGGPPVINQ